MSLVDHVLEQLKTMLLEINILYLRLKSFKTLLLKTLVQFCRVINNTYSTKFFVCLHGDKTYNVLFVETPRKSETYTCYYYSISISVVLTLIT